MTTIAPEDRTFDRIFQDDPRNADYPIAALLTTDQPRSYTWRCDVWLDQLREGACVGFAWAHEANARPAVVPATTEDARAIYHRAQVLDGQPWPQGTSIIAGAKASQEFGWLEEYRWANGLEDALVAISRKGPAVVGSHWYSGMFRPDSDGMIRKTGQRIGGHGYLVNGVSVKKQLVRVHNSWGPDWGLGGDAFLTWDDFGALIDEDGEVCIPVTRIV